MQVYRNYHRNGVEYFYRKSAPPPFCSHSTMPREAKRRTYTPKPYIIFYNVIVGSTVKTTAKPRAARRKRRRRRDEESIETAVTRKRIITGSATHVARLNSPADRAAGGFAENQKRQKF